MLKLVAFDLDGTIADTVFMCIEAFRDALSPYVGHILSDKEITDTFGMNEIGTVKALVKEHVEDALIDFLGKYEEYHKQCEKPYKDIVPLINMLRKKGLIIAMVTGKGSGCCALTLEKFRMTEMFSDVMTGNEVSNNKAMSFRYLMDKYNLSAQECVYVGDAVSDVLASQKAGIRCLSAAWSESADKESLEKVNPGNVFCSISEIREYFEKI